MIKHDQEVEQLIVKVLDKAIKDNYKLKFEKPDEFTAVWSHEEIHWKCSKITDPFSLVLLIKRPERNNNADDNEVVSSLSVYLKRSPVWIKSFQHAWCGENNKSGSITGYLLGDKLRRKYLI